MNRWRDIKDIDPTNNIQDLIRDIANSTGLAEVDENGLTWNQATIDKKWELMYSKTDSIYINLRMGSLEGLDGFKNQRKRKKIL